MLECPAWNCAVVECVEKHQTGHNPAEARRLTGPLQSLLVATLCLHLEPSELPAGCIGRYGVGREVNLLEVAFFTSASAAFSATLASGCAGEAAGTGAAAAGAGAGTGALLAAAGVGSVFAGSGAAAGAGAGAVSVFAGAVAVCELDGVSVVAVGFGSSFLFFFLLKRPLKAFFT